MLLNDSLKTELNNTEVMANFEEIEKNIEYLLQLKPEGLPVADFEDEYLQFTGDCFPHRHFGYASPDEFLRRFHKTAHMSSGYLLPANRTKHPPRQITSKTSKDGEKMTFSIVSEEMKMKLRVIISKYPEGMPASQLLREYRVHYGREMDTYGCKSVVELCELLNDVFILEKEGTGEWMLYCAAKNEKKKEIYDRLVDSGFEQPKNKTVSDLNKAKCSQDSDLFATSSRITPCANGKLLRLEGTNIDEKYRSVLGPGDEIPSQKLPSGLKYGDFIDVHIVEILTPNRFFFQLLDLNNSEKCQSLSEEMENFYQVSSEHYKIAEKEVIVGLHCVCLYDINPNWWPYYRCRVTAFVDLNTVEVFFIDYGNVIKVKKDSLLYLPKIFAKFPGQAFKARLAWIKPPRGRRSYPRESLQRFKSLIQVTPDAAFLAVVRGLEEKLSLWLVDTVTNDLPQGIALNQVLVDEGLAVPETEVVCHESFDHVTPLRLPAFGEATNAITEKTLDQLKDLHMSSEQSKQSDLSTDGMATLEEVKLDGHTCHLITKEGSVWMASYQISAFIPRWKEKDLLSKMLSLKQVHIPSITVTASSDRSLYSRLKRIVNDENCREITAYSLKSIPYILDTFLLTPRVGLRKDLQKLTDKAQQTKDKDPSD